MRRQCATLLPRRQHRDDDRRLRSAAGTIGWHVESTGVAHSISLDDRAARELHAFVSLYNREAVFEIVSRDTSDK